jgi:hypothetical protein
MPAGVQFVVLAVLFSPQESWSTSSAVLVFFVFGRKITGAKSEVVAAATAFVSLAAVINVATLRRRFCGAGQKLKIHQVLATARRYIAWKDKPVKRPRPTLKRGIVKTTKRPSGS